MSILTSCLLCLERLAGYRRTRFWCLSNEESIHGKVAQVNEQKELLPQLKGLMQFP